MQTFHNHVSKRVAAILVAVAAVGMATACGDGVDRHSSESGRNGTPTGGVDLTGAGATFPYPLYSKWFAMYAEKTGVKINYQSIGSGGGIRQLSERTVDFGASDAPMTDEEMGRATGGSVLHVPTVLGAVVVTYNLPGVSDALKLSGDVVADIFLGRITRWSDTRIASLNDGVTLPDADILVVHRSDGSGTTYIFTDFLNAVSPAWSRGPGKGKEVQWPAGLGAKGNEGVAGQVKQTPGAIGYVELAYATQNRLPTASIQNPEGHFVAPTIDAVTAAAAGAIGSLTDETDYRISIVNAPGAMSYPISSFTWMLVYRNGGDSVKTKKLTEFLVWALHEGGQSAASLDYAPLPGSMVSRLDSVVRSISAGSSK